MLRSWTALAVASGALFVALWIVLPPPTMAFLGFALLGSELGAPLLVVATLATALSFVDRRLAPARLASVFAGAAAVLASLPLAQVPGTVRQFDAAMRAGLGDDFLAGVTTERLLAMRPQPLVVLDLFRGIEPGDAVVTRGVTFASPEGVPLTLDVYRPPAAGRYPVVVQIHGGGWQSGSAGENAGFARYLAAHGYVVFSIDYRRAPRWRWPAALDDVRAALAWVRDHAAEHDGDSSSLALVGRSAGAHLALLAAYAPGGPPVRAVVDFYGPTDLAEGYRHPPSPDPADVRSILEVFLGGRPDDMPGRYREASPVAYANRPQPPTLLIYGAHDHLVEARFGRSLAERLRASGTKAVLLEIPWAEHAFDFVPGPGRQLALYYVERFLAWSFSSKGPGTEAGRPRS